MLVVLIIINYKVWWKRECPSVVRHKPKTVRLKKTVMGWGGGVQTWWWAHSNGITRHSILTKQSSLKAQVQFYKNKFRKTHEAIVKRQICFRLTIRTNERRCWQIRICTKCSEPATSEKAKIHDVLRVNILLCFPSVRLMANCSSIVQQCERREKITNMLKTLKKK
jgi:hypothetical protein